MVKANKNIMRQEQQTGDTPSVQDTSGPLLLIGGAEDKVGSQTILHHFVQLAGSQQARIAVIATASAFHDMVGQRYAEIFQAIGAGHAEVLPLHNRLDARQPEVLARLDSMSGVFLTGGDQLKLTAVLGGTPIAARLRLLRQQGAVIAGTSAGASAAAEHMLAYGSSGIPPRKAMMQFAPGLGFVGGVIVDQHFGARGRSGRLLTAVAHNPDLLGIGLDEDTAIEVWHNGLLTVVGSGSVMIVDGIDISHTNIHQVAEQAPIAMCGLRIHMLTHGYGYHTHTRTPQMPAAAPPVHAEAGTVANEDL